MIEQAEKPMPGPTDLVRMAVREAFSPEIYGKYGYHLDYPPDFAKHMGSLGFDEFWSKAYWAAHWELPSVSLGFEMYHREIMSKADMELLLRVSDYPVYWRDKMIQAAFNPYTRVDVRRMYKLKVLTREQVKKCYKELGYDEEHAENLTEFTIRYETASGQNKMEGYQDMTYGLIEQAYRKEILTLSEAQAELKEIGYASDDVSVLSQLMQAKQALDRIPDWASEHSRDFKSLIEKAYTRRLISRGEASSALSALGVSARSIEFILAIADYNYAQGTTDTAIKVIGDAYVARAINRTEAAVQFGRLNLPATLQDQHLLEWDTQRELRSRRLTEAQYRKALSYELITLEQYQECLRGLGYTEFDIDLLRRMAAE
jgi:hypothetical protein